MGLQEGCRHRPLCMTHTFLDDGPGLHNTPSTNQSHCVSCLQIQPSQAVKARFCTNCHVPRAPGHDACIVCGHRASADGALVGEHMVARWRELLAKQVRPGGGVLWARGTAKLWG